MNDFFLVVIQNCLVATFLAGIVFCATRVWRSPPAAHLLWLLVLIKLVTPPLVRIEWSPVPVAKQERTQARIPVSPIPQTDLLLPVADRQKITGPLGSSALPTAATTQLLSPTIAETTDNNLYSMLTYRWQQLAPWLACIWLLGSLVFAASAVLRIVRFHHLLGGALPGSQKVQNLCDELANKLRIAHRPQIRIAEDLHSPMVWPVGTIPTIVLPAELARTLDDRQLALVLTHELAHLGRRDHWVRCFELLVSVLYWWNPLVWWTRRQLHSLEEQCCDAWVGWFHPDSARTYAEVLLLAAQRFRSKAPSAPILATSFFHSHSLKGRIEMILEKRVSRNVSPKAWAIVFLFACLLLPSFGLATEQVASETPADKTKAASSADDTGKTLGKMTGTVTVDGTGEPVAGATVSVLTGGSNDDGSQKTVEAKTDDQGRYSASIPLGNIVPFNVDPPPGYWWEEEFRNESVVTTTTKPVFTKNYRVKKGAAWTLRIRETEGSRPVVGMSLGSQQMETDSYRWGSGQSDDTGVVRLTPPGPNGKFRLQLFDLKLLYEPRTSVWIEFEPGFQPDQAGEITANTQTYQIKDKQGKLANVAGVKPAIENGVFILDFGVKPQPANKFAKVFGTVVDEQDQPISEAAVGLAYGSQTGSGLFAGYEVKSDANGQFVIDRIPVGEDFAENSQIQLVVFKQGYAGNQSEWQPLPQVDRPADMGKLRLVKGTSRNIRVVGPAGEPIAGAWVEPTSNWATRNQIATTDANGVCVVEDLSKGFQPFMVRYGDSIANVNVLVDGTDTQSTVQLQKIPVPPPAETQAATRPLKPVQPGTLAPPLSVAGWTDGKTRTLADFKGKVVVVDFWGIWCGSCLHSLAAIKNLQAKYTDGDVVFLALHTPGTGMLQLQEFQREHNWQAHIGLDKGDSQFKPGETAKKYAVEGYPTVVVIGRDGNVTFNSLAIEGDEGMQKLKAVAEKLSIAWPIDETAPQEQIIEKIGRIQEYIYSQAIDEALAGSRK